MAQDLRIGAAMPAPTLSSRAKVLVLTCVLAGIGLAVLRPRDLILYNPTGSLEQGFYIRAGQPVERGVVVTVPVHTSRLAYVREGHVRAAGDRFLKRIAAIGGDRVCSGDGQDHDQRCRGSAGARDGSGGYGIALMVWLHHAEGRRGIPARG